MAIARLCYFNIRKIMYLPQIFSETNPTVLSDFIQTHPLGTLISLQNGVPQADLLPFYVVQDGDKITLVTHIAKANPLAHHAHKADVMVLFYGEQGYITPNWYPTKHIHHRHVPTWNYEVVEVRGQATLFDDFKGLMRAVGTLTNIHEKEQPTAWKMKDAPADYLADELKDIVGLTIDVDTMVGKFKLSQNREQVDFDGVVSGLTKSGQAKLAQAVARTRYQMSDNDDSK